MTELQGLIVAAVFLWIAAASALVYLWFNYRATASMAMVCVLIGFTVLVFHHYLPSEKYVASERPLETFYHVTDGCIHGPTHALEVKTFATEDEARRTGRVPCRCVKRDGESLLTSRERLAPGHR